MTSTIARAESGSERAATVHEGKTLLYRASKLDAMYAPLKPQCCPKEPSRQDPAPTYMSTPQGRLPGRFAGTEVCVPKNPNSDHSGD